MINPRAIDILVEDDEDVSTLQTFVSVSWALGREGWNMKRVFKPRYVALTVVAVMLATVIPTAFAQEAPGPNGPVSGGDESVLYLTRGPSDFFEWEGNKENIRTRNNDCTAITFTGDDLVTVTADGGVLGDVKDGFGVLSASDGSGEPCGRIDAPDQALVVELSGLLSDHAMSRVDLDLELKFSAVATLRFYADGQPLTPDAVRRSADGEPHPISAGVVTFDPESATGDNGPDSKDGDNYRVYAEPVDNCETVEGTTTCEAVYFDKIVISATEGAVSLEGGADLANNADQAAFGQIDPNSRSSQFGVQRIYDGTLDCGDSVTVGDGVNTPKGTFTRVNYSLTSECVLKVYDLSTSFVAGVNQIDFAPSADAVARYTADLTSVPYPAENPVTQTLTYDPDLDGTYQTMQWCLTDPGAGWATVADSTTVLPSGESWCITGSDTQLLGDGTIQTTWSVIGEDDPGFRFG